VPRNWLKKGAEFVPWIRDSLGFELERLGAPIKATRIVPRSLTMRWTWSRNAHGFCILLALCLLTFVPSASATESNTAHATKITLDEGQSGTVEVSIDFSRSPTYTARLERNGRRLVLDVPHADLRGAPAALTDSVGVVGGIMAQTFKTKNGKTARFLINLLADAKYGVRVEENRLLVRFEPGGTGVLSSAKKRTKPLQADATTRTTSVRDVRFSHDELQDQVVIDVSGRVVYRQQSDGKGRSTLVIQDASLPKALMRTLDVSAFAGSVDSVSTYRKNGNVVVEVERSENVTSDVQQKGNALYWSFFEPGSLPSSMTGVGRDGKTARRSQTVSVVEGYEDVWKKKLFLPTN
jgi:hypothetical protein